MSRNVNIYKSSNGRQYVRVSESYRNADDDMLAAFGLKPLCRLEEKAFLRRKLRLKTALRVRPEHRASFSALA